jgi:phage-related baseplate assembly protein
LDAESDAAFRARFVLYLASLSKATKGAIGAAILSARQGLQYTLLENTDTTGGTVYGFMTITVDDMTGYPPSDLISSAAIAVEAVRPVGSRYAVLPPAVLTANVSMTVTSAPGYVHADVVGAVGVALTAFVNALPLGATLPYTQLAAVAYAVPGVSNVSAVLLNAGSSDVASTPRNKIIAGTVTVA